tara:strand:+ start:338 stop:529 length:192 start_codon:yes stop_codon:yes gene_type:complete
MDDELLEESNDPHYMRWYNTYYTEVEELWHNFLSTGRRMFGERFYLEGGMPRFTQVIYRDLKF